MTVSVLHMQLYCSSTGYYLCCPYAGVLNSVAAGIVPTDTSIGHIRTLLDVPPVTSLFGKEVNVVRETNFQFILLASGCGALGTALISPILESLIGPFGTTPSDIGLMMSAYMAPIIVMVPVAGILSDRYGRKAVLTGGLLVFGTAGVAIGFTTSFHIALVLRALQGVGFAGTIPVGIASLGDLYNGEKAATAHGFRMAGSGGFQTAFPILAGVLVGIAWYFPFMLFAFCIPTAVLLYALMDEPMDINDDGPSRGRNVDSEGANLRQLLEFVRRKRVLPMVVAYTLFPIIWFGFLTYNSVVVVQVLNGTPTQSGLLAGLASLCYAAAGTQSGQLTTFLDSQHNVLVGANLAMGVGFIAFVLAPSPAAAAIGVLVMGTGFGIIGSLYRKIITEIAPPDLRGGLVSFAESIFWVTSTLTPIGMGAIIAFGSPIFGFPFSVKISIVTTAVIGSGLSVVSLQFAETEPSNHTT